MAEQDDVTATMSPSYGGFWARALAIAVDSAILLVATVLIIGGAGFALGAGTLVPLAFLLWLAGFLYWPLMHASARQATLGKQMLGLKVTGYSGERISILRAIARELGKILSGAVFMLGYLMAAFTARKQALHDLVASTYVVQDGPSRVGRALLVSVAGFILVPVIAFALFGGMVTAFMGGMMAGMMGQPMTQEAIKPMAPRPAPPRVVAAAKPAAPVSTAQVKPAAAADAKSGTLILPGTFMWDTKNNAVGGSGDLWWQHKSDTERQLTPQFGAAIAVAGKDAFDKLDAQEMAKLEFSTAPLAGNDGLTALDPGAVLALRTADGKLMKLKVLGYRDSHDTAFSGSQVLTENWKQQVKGKPKIDRYHIGLQWEIVPGMAIVASKPDAGKAKDAEMAAKVPAMDAEKSKSTEPPKSASVAASPSPAPASPSVEAPKIRAPKLRAAPKPVAAALAAPAPEPKAGPRYNDVMTAVLYRDRNALAELLAMGKWVDKPDSRGTTPLMAAVMLGDGFIAEALLKAGADPNRAVPVARERRDQAMSALLQRHGGR